MFLGNESNYVTTTQSFVFLFEFSALPLHVTVAIWEIIIVSVVVMVGAIYAGVCGVITNYS